MVFQALVLILCAAFISGCASAKAVGGVRKGPATMEEVYRQGSRDAVNDAAKLMAGQLTQRDTLGYVKPYVPVIEPPVVRKVWVPDRKSEQDGSVMVAGHWVYVMLSKPRWFMENATGEAFVPVVVPMPPGTQKAENAH